MILNTAMACIGAQQCSKTAEARAAASRAGSGRRLAAAAAAARLGFAGRPAEASAPHLDRSTLLSGP